MFDITDYCIAGNFRGVQISFCAISSWFVCLIFVLSNLHRKTHPSLHKFSVLNFVLIDWESKEWNLGPTNISRYTVVLTCSLQCAGMCIAVVHILYSEKCTTAQSFKFGNSGPQPPSMMSLLRYKPSLVVDPILVACDLQLKEGLGWAVFVGTSSHPTLALFSSVYFKVRLS